MSIQLSTLTLGSALAALTGAFAIGGLAVQRLRAQRGELERCRRELAQAEAARAAAEAGTRALQQRYLLALRGSQDGLWEWDLETGAVHLSPRWQGMLGFEPGELAETLAGWRERVHPDDRAGFEAALRRHLDGPDPAVDHELRLVHRDGRVRHVLCRAAAIRREDGSPRRLVGLDTDVTRLRRTQAVLDAVAEGTGGAFGHDFFARLAQHFARALELDCAFVTECLDQPPTRVRTLAFWSAAEGLAANFEYALADTPCEAVIGGATSCFHRSGLAQAYPVEAGFEAYLGLPILGSRGQVLGHLAFLHREPLGDEVLVDRVYRIFTARAAAEIERLRALEQATDAPRGQVAIGDQGERPR